MEKRGILYVIMITVANAQEQKNTPKIIIIMVSILSADEVDSTWRTRWEVLNDNYYYL